MIETILGVLIKVGNFIPINTIIDFFSKKIFPFVKKNWKIILPIIIAMMIVGYGIRYVIQLNAEVAKWRNEAAKNRGLELVAKNTYETTAIENNKLKNFNKELEDRIKQTDRKVKFYSSLSLEYKIKLDSIRTVAAGSVHLQPAQNNVVIVSPKDSTDRIFNTSYNNELFLSGFFQVHEPFFLFISELKLKSKIDLLVSVDEKTNQYYGTVSTNSSFLRPSDFKIFVSPPETHLEYFYGAGMNYTSTLSGLGFTGGLKKGEWSLYGGVEFTKETNVYRIGILKFGWF